MKNNAEFRTETHGTSRRSGPFVCFVLCLIVWEKDRTVVKLTRLQKSEVGVENTLVDFSITINSFNLASKLALRCVWQEGRRE